MLWLGSSDAIFCAVFLAQTFGEAKSDILDGLQYLPSTTPSILELYVRPPKKWSNERFSCTRTTTFLILLRPDAVEDCALKPTRRLKYASNKVIIESVAASNKTENDSHLASSRRGSPLTSRCHAKRTVQPLSPHASPLGPFRVGLGENSIGHGARTTLLGFMIAEFELKVVSNWCYTIYHINSLLHDHLRQYLKCNINRILLYLSIARITIFAFLFLDQLNANGSCAYLA